MLPAAEINPLVRKLPLSTLPDETKDTPDTAATEITLPPVTLPVALTCAAVRIFPPVTLPTADIVVPAVIAFDTANTPVLPTACATLYVVPPTLAWMTKLPLEMLLLMLASVLVVLTANTFAAPTVSPKLFKTATVPVVDVFAVARMKSVLSKLSNNCALVADPAYTGEPVLYKVIPLYMVGNVVTVGAEGVKLESLLTMATLVLFTYKLVT